MKRVAPWFLSLILAGSLLAAGPDDDYVRIYGLIQQGDGFDQKGERAKAAEVYIEASKSLQRLQASYPGWNMDAVRFRLDYLEEKLQIISRLSPPDTKTASAAKAAPKTVTTAELQQEVQQLRATSQRLADEKISLEAKLKEALSLAPPPVDPRDLARAQDQVAAQQRELDILKAALEQEKAKTADVQKIRDESDQKKAASTDAKRIQQLEKELATLKAQFQGSEKQIVELQAAVKTSRSASTDRRITQLEGALKDEQRKVEKLKRLQITEAETEASQVRQLKQERDELKRKLERSGKALNESQSQTKASLISEVDPVTIGEVLFAGGEINLQVEPVVVPEKKKRRELPPGSGPLVAEAERAFAARRFEEAEKKYLLVLRQDEKNVDILGNVAAVQWELGHFEEAEKNLNKALAIDPEDPFCLRRMGMIRFRENKFEDALKLLSQSAKLDPQSAETQNYLGIVLSQKGDQPEAEAALRKALKLQPAYAEAHYNIAIVYSSQKPPFMELARWHYRKSKGLGHPGNPAMEELLKEK
ncbi:MAG: tetratricopeptide repeat protein [Opitutaceae bacterium]|nr:tetratricopeptide repeat protein [Verrucomicrobiales bacterium]